MRPTGPLLALPSFERSLDPVLWPEGWRRRKTDADSGRKRVEPHRPDRRIVRDGALETDTRQVSVREVRTPEIGEIELDSIQASAGEIGCREVRGTEVRSFSPPVVGLRV